MSIGFALPLKHGQHTTAFLADSILCTGCKTYEVARKLCSFVNSSSRRREVCRSSGCRQQRTSFSNPDYGYALGWYGWFIAGGAAPAEAKSVQGGTHDVC